MASTRQMLHHMRSASPRPLLKHWQLARSIRHGQLQFGAPGMISMRFWSSGNNVRSISLPQHCPGQLQRQLPVQARSSGNMVSTFECLPTFFSWRLGFTSRHLCQVMNYIDACQQG